VRRSPLGKRAQEAWSHCTTDNAPQCEALRQGQKNDAADAEAISEAVTRPSMRFVEIKTCEQQGMLVLRRVRLMLTRQRTQLSNAIRGHMADYALVAPVGRNGLQRPIPILANPDDERVPAVAALPWRRWCASSGW